MSLALADKAARKDSISAGRRLAAIVLLVLVVPLIISYGLIVSLGGAPVRMIYPVYILIVACVVIATHRPLYPAFILGVLAFAPFLRRIADYQAGFAVFNPILLAPFVGLLPTLPALLRRSVAGRTMGWPFALISICIVYAAFLAMFRMAFVPAVYEGLRWLLPTALGAFIMAEPAEGETVRRAVLAGLCLIVPILTVYGVYQFVVAPPWDTTWMLNIDNKTFGFPTPFKIRVFSMMNSPGTVGVFVSSALIFLAGEANFMLLIAVCGLPLLGLTLIRTAWLSVAVGMAVLFACASTGRRFVLVVSLIMVGITATLAFSSNALPPELRNLVSDRIATFSELGTDTSTFERLNVYTSFFNRLSRSPWGEGFGVNASTVTVQESGREMMSIDSGLLETYLIFGVIGGTLYFIAFGALAFQAWRIVSRCGGRLDANIAVICAAIAILPLGSNQVGEVGVPVWIAIGTIFARAAQMQQNGGPGKLSPRGR